MLDGDGHVAEFATANLWIVRDGVVATPAPNGSFLNGITRQRVLSLLRADGITVQECALTQADVEQADEIFSTGNYGKVVPVHRIENRVLKHGPLARRAHRLYREYAHARGK
jgi:branched-chain amino acid aminotransferase